MVSLLHRCFRTALQQADRDAVERDPGSFEPSILAVFVHADRCNQLEAWEQGRDELVIRRRLQVPIVRGAP